MAFDDSGEQSEDCFIFHLIVKMTGQRKENVHRHSPSSLTTKARSPPTSHTTPLRKRSPPNTINSKVPSAREKGNLAQSKWKEEDSWWQMRRSLLHVEEHPSLDRLLGESELVQIEATPKFSLRGALNEYRTPASNMDLSRSMLSDARQSHVIEENEQPSPVRTEILVSAVLSEEEQMKLLSAADIHVLKGLLHAGSERDSLSRTARELKAVSKACICYPYTRTFHAAAASFVIMAGSL